MQCKTCKGELVIDEVRECLVCPVCHPSGAPKPKFNDGAIPDVIFSEVHENEIRRIVRDEHQKIVDAVIEYKNDWRGDAKALGIPVYDQVKKCPRKKVDVLKDIEEKSLTKDNNETP